MLAGSTNAVTRERLAAHGFTLLVIAAWALAATQIPPIAMSGPWTTLKALRQLPGRGDLNATMTVRTAEGGASE